MKSEQGRWVRRIKNLKAERKSVLGDVYMAANMLSYFGPLSATARSKLLARWSKLLQGFEIPYTYGLEIEDTLGKKSKIQTWVKNGLLDDKFFFINMLVFETNNSPTLIYEPNGHAIAWIKRNRKQRSEFVQLNEENFLEKLQHSLENGKLFVVEGYVGAKTSLIEELLKEDIFLVDGTESIQINGVSYEYNEDFRLVLISKSTDIFEK